MHELVPHRTVNTETSLQEVDFAFQGAAVEVMLEFSNEIRLARDTVVSRAGHVSIREFVEVNAAPHR